MKMVNSLVRGAANMISASDLAASLCGAAQGLEAVWADLESKPLRAALKARGLDCGTPIDLWSLPDAIWIALSRKNPALLRYPLGEIAERSVKKSILDLLPRSNGSGPPNLTLIAGENLIEVFLRSSIKSTSLKTRLSLLLSNYFFELAIDYLRRPPTQKDQDWAWGYHFAKDGRAVSTRAESRFRRLLAAQCYTSAVRLLPFLLPALQRSSKPVEQEILKGVIEVFGARPRQHAGGRAKPRKPYVNVVVGARSLAELKQSFTVTEDDLIRLTLDGKQPNVTCKFSVFEDFLGRPLHSLTRDFLEIGAAVYIADLHCKRAANLKRRLGLVMPVRHLGIWTRATPLLERAASELGSDDFAVHFRKRKQKADQIKPIAATSDRDCVCLFSGGIDSLAGVVWALEKGLQPVLVSHFANPALSGIQNSVAAALEAANGLKVGTYSMSRGSDRPASGGQALRKWAQVMKTPADANLASSGRQGSRPARVHFFLNEKKGKRAPHALPPKARSIMAEYARSFLFLSAACAVAWESGIKTVYIFENGPVALNPLLSEGTVTTHTAHPHFLARFQDLVTSVFGQGLRIENPFLYKTKGEVTTILARPTLKRLLKKSNSCWNWFRVPMDAKGMGSHNFRGRHDGVCLPCILRRTSVHTAELWNQDARYLVDVFDQYSNLKPETKGAIADLLRFCQNVITLSGSELLSFAPDLSVYEDHIDSRLLVEMYRRHAREVIECFRKRSDLRLKRAFKALL